MNIHLFFEAVGVIASIIFLISIAWLFFKPSDRMEDCIQVGPHLNMGVMTTKDKINILENLLELHAAVYMDNIHHYIVLGQLAYTLEKLKKKEGV